MLSLPPSSSVDYLNQLCAHLETVKSNHPNSAIWLSGDLNLPNINCNWEYIVLMDIKTLSILLTLS